MANENNSKDTKSEDKAESDSVEERRNLLKFGLAIGVVLAIGGVGAVAKTLVSPSSQAVAQTSSTTTSTTTSTATSSVSGSSVTTQSPTIPQPASPGFPVILVANVSSLQVGTPVSFNYPLEETPNILVKLGVKAKNGVGPDGDIVAFSVICQHLGCIWGFVGSGSSPSCNSSFTASGPIGYCCCHGSEYDLTNAAKVIGGPAPRPVPGVILSYDSTTGNIYAIGMTPPTIFGFDTGSNNVSNDLVGGTLVS